MLILGVDTVLPAICAPRKDFVRRVALCAQSIPRRERMIDVLEVKGDSSRTRVNSKKSTISKDEGSERFVLQFNA